MMHIERVGRRTLVCGAVLAIAGLLLLSRSPAQELKFDPPKQQQLGRYQILMHPTFRGDQYLLDTTTGHKSGNSQNSAVCWVSRLRGCR